MPHIDLREPSCFTEVPVAPQTYTLNVLCLQEEGAQIRMSEWSLSFTLTKNVARGFILCSTSHSGLSDSPIRWRYLLRVLCPGRRPVAALDCVLLKDTNLALQPDRVLKLTLDSGFGCHQDLLLLIQCCQFCVLTLLVLINKVLFFYI